MEVIAPSGFVLLPLLVLRIVLDAIHKGDWLLDEDFVDHEPQLNRQLFDWEWFGGYGFFGQLLSRNSSSTASRECPSFRSRALSLLMMS